MKCASHYWLLIACTLYGCTTHTAVAPEQPTLPQENKVTTSNQQEGTLETGEMFLEKVDKPEINPKKINLFPPTHQLKVPFSSQAPHANWDDPYQEACEEMSALMAHWYLSDQYKEKDPLPDEADRELLEFLAFEDELDYPMDITIKELAGLMEYRYKYNYKVIYNPSIEDIKVEISSGRPVIVPAAGRELNNPYFSGEGPWYHMLVITGYDRRHFVTNDPGTRRGKNYRYRFKTLIDAIHDWPGTKEQTPYGFPAVISVYKN